MYELILGVLIGIPLAYFIGYLLNLPYEIKQREELIEYAKEEYKRNHKEDE